MGFFSGHRSFEVVEKAVWESYEVSVSHETIRRVAMRRAGVRPGDRVVALADGATALE
ncbi:MAG: hypothetical protein HY314_15895 [Acidobacteria bacterium]|nr:hypothetical protein [Acidobacteriota bacterium]